MLPDPRTPDRLSVWFTGGTLEPAADDGRDLEEWGRIFTEGNFHSHCKGKRGGGGALPPLHFLKQRAWALAARIFMGAEIPNRMEANGSMAYYLHRPVGGHGTSYVDVLYLDNTLRVLRGHHGTVYVFARVLSVPED